MGVPVGTVLPSTTRSWTRVLWMTGTGGFMRKPSRMHMVMYFRSGKSSLEKKEIEYDIILISFNLIIILIQL